MAEETNGPKIIHMVFSDGQGNPDDDPDHERSENEIYYDDVIAPKLAEIAKMCEARGMSMVCDVEYDPGETGSTRFMQPTAGAKLKIAYAASRCRGNVDALIMGINNMMREEGSLDVSIYMKLIEDRKNGKVGTII